MLSHDVTHALTFVTGTMCTCAQLQGRVPLGCRTLKRQSVHTLVQRLVAARSYKLQLAASGGSLSAKQCPVASIVHKE